MSEREEVLARRFRLALDLHETGVALKRQNLRRRHPDASDSEIDLLLAEWLQGPIEALEAKDLEVHVGWWKRRVSSNPTHDPSERRQE